MATAKEQARATRRVEDLRAEARYASERYHLYQARMYGLRPTTMSRLRELERIHQGAESRLRRVQAELAQSEDSPRAVTAPPAPQQAATHESL